MGQQETRGHWQEGGGHLCLLAVKSQCRLAIKGLQVDVPNPLDTDTVQDEGRE